MEGSESELRACVVDVFDPLETGYMNKKRFTNLLTTIGEKLSEEELNKMLCDFKPDGEGEIKYEGTSERYQLPGTSRIRRL